MSASASSAPGPTPAGGNKSTPLSQLPSFAPALPSDLEEDATVREVMGGLAAAAVPAAAEPSTAAGVVMPPVMTASALLPSVVPAHMHRAILSTLVTAALFIAVTLAPIERIAPLPPAVTAVLGASGPLLLRACVMAVLHAGVMSLLGL